MKPKRIQRKRTKGWRMPKNTVYVGRPSKWGNPYRAGESYFGLVPDAAYVVEAYRSLMTREIKEGHFDLKELRGKDLCCWCKVGDPCHADILLELANQ